MSGGSYDYAFNRIDELACQIRARSETDPRRVAFANLLAVCAKAAHDIEWVDSCDYGPGDDHAAIDAALSFGGGNPATIVEAEAFRITAEILKNAGYRLVKEPA